MLTKETKRELTAALFALDYIYRNASYADQNGKMVIPAPSSKDWEILQAPRNIAKFIPDIAVEIEKHRLYNELQSIQEQINDLEKR